MYTKEPVIEIMTRNGNGYFTVNWSKILTGDKYSIQTGVPSMSGIYEIYYKDHYGKLVLMEINFAWYGGVRAELRRITDPTLEEDASRRAFLEGKKLFFRYSLSRSIKDMQDTVFFLAQSNPPVRQPEEPREHSGRFRRIYLKETSPNKITTI